MILLNIILSSCTFILVFFPGISVQQDPTELLKVVPKFKDVERFFLLVRKENEKPKKYRPENIKNPEVKSRICENILKSSVFSKLRLQYTRLDRWFWAKDWPRMTESESLLEEVANEDGVELSRFNLPYKKRLIHVGMTNNDLEENSFRCMAIREEKHLYIRLFVSEEYNVNLEESDNPIYIPGRFVFMYDEGMEKMRPRFVAVKPADILQILTDKVEALYVESQARTTQYANDDPVCRSRHQSKLIQICHSVLNSWQIAFNYILVSYDERNIGCEENIVLFRFYSNRGKKRKWMINCQTMLKDAYNEYEFYVSYGTGPEDFFVYRSSMDDDEEEVYVYNLSSNIVKYYMGQ